MMKREFLSALGASLFVSLLMACQSSANDPEPSQQTVAETVAEDGKSLLWKIEGKDLEKPSHLFGTMHLIGEEDFVVTELTQARFDASELIVMELDMDDIDMVAAAQKMVMPYNETLDQIMDSVEYFRLSEFFEDKVGTKLKFVHNMKPLMLTTLIYTSLVEGKMESYEEHFKKSAASQDKEIKGLETLEEQLGYFDQIPLKEQIEMLMEYVNDFENQKEMTFKMIDLYVDQDVQGLQNLIAEETVEYKEFEDILLLQRNANWIPKMEELMKEQSVFFAVGAGHLGGENGVIEMLKDAGYTVTPIR